MARSTVVLDLAGKHELARDLAAGGVFVPGAQVALNEECELVVRGAEELRVPALVVFVNGVGAGLQLVGCDSDLKQKIAALASPPETAAAAEPPEAPAPQEAADDPEPQQAATDVEPADNTPAAKNMHERLRGLTLVQQVRMARDGELSERILLERFYGKNVWEHLLRNPRITGPEVSRIARMGALPRPLLELIVGNGGWLQIPEVRRALLSNPRLGADQIQRVLRLMPKHELKLAAIQTAYPFGVRDTARRMLKD